MNVWFDNAGLYETFEDVDLSEYFEEDPDWDISYKGYRMRKL